MEKRITEAQWRHMLRKSDALQAMARACELRGDKDGYRRAWKEMGPLHRAMRSESAVVVRADGSTF